MRRRSRSRIALVALAASLLASHVALAASPPAPSASSTTTTTTTDSVRGCVESVPAGAQRPVITDVFPARGTSGYAAILEVTVEHGKGESVLPRGLELQSASEAASALRAAGFVIPDQDGGAAARIQELPPDPKVQGRTTTKLALPLLALPTEPGRHTLTLPALPISVARANGEIATVCTRPHLLTVEDPTASTPNAEPKPNPPPRPQREEWTAMKNAAQWVGIGALLGALILFALYRISKRPKAVPPPPPPRPPWEIALEKLDEVRHAGLLETGRFSEYFDRVNDALRAYLGARFGFDGLESTTDEIMAAMKHVPHFGVPLPEIQLFLEECDLVKFANLTPSQEECVHSLGEGEKIVRRTMPYEGVVHHTHSPSSSSPPPSSPSSQGARA
jgi:hypothetical protein